MPEWWTYQPRATYNQRQGDQFRRLARNHIWNQVVAPSIASEHNSSDPQMAVRPLPTFADKRPQIVDTTAVNATEAAPKLQPSEQFNTIAHKLGVESPNKGRGVLGLLGDAAEVVGLNDIEQPWDVLRPVKRILDAENRYIARPLAEGLYEGITGDDYESAPGLFKFGVETVLSPTTYIGVGTVTTLYKISKGLALAAPTIASMAASGGSRRGILSVLDDIVKQARPAPAGGAPEPEELVKFLERLNKVPDDLIGARGIQEVYDASRKSWTQQFRGRLDTLLTPGNANKLLDFGRSKVRGGIEGPLGIRLFDGPAVPIINEYQRHLSLGSNLATMGSEQIRIAIGKSLPVDRNFELITDQKLIDEARGFVPDMQIGDPLHIEDFIEFSDNFTSLTGAQKLAIEAYEAQMDIFRQAEKAGRVGITDRPQTAGKYVHHERIRRPEEIAEYGDDLTLTGTRTVKETLGQVVGNRLGKTQSAQVPRQFKSKIEGIHNGFEYLPFLEAQRARMHQGAKLLADEWMDRALGAAELNISRSPTALLPEDLVKNAFRLGNIKAPYLTVARKIDEAIRHGERGSAFTPIRSDLLAKMPQEVQDLVNKAMYVNTVTPKSQRVADFHALREQINSALDPVLKELSGVNQQLKVARKNIERGGTAEFPVEFNGRFYKRPVGEVLNAELRPPPPSGIEKSLISFNTFARPLMATLDLSFLGIQGLIGLATNPIAYKNAMINTFAHYDTYVEKALRTGLADDFIKASGFFAARNDYGEFIFPKLITKIPGLGKVAEASNTSFTRFGNVLRMEMYRTGAFSKGLNRAQKRDFAQLVNKATGYTDSKTTPIENIGLFAPRFFRAQFGILADAVTKHDLGSRGAARMMAQLIGEGVALTTMVNETFGQELDGWLDPDSPNFMRFRVLDHDVSIFGPWDTLAKIAFKSINPIWGGDEGPFDAAVYAARVKASPAITRIWDLVAGETFMGDETRDFSSPSAMVESFYNNAKGSFLPISAQNILSEDLPTNPKEFGATGLELLGIKSSPLSDWENKERTKSQLARDKFSKPWDDLEPYQMVEILESSPDLEDYEPRNSYQQALAMKDSISERIQPIQDKNDRELTGRRWLDAYYKLRAEQSGMYKQWEAEHPEAAAKLKAREPKNAEEAALKAYYDFFDKAEELGYLPEDIAEGLAELESTMTEGQLAYIERNTGLRNTDKVKEFRKVQKLLRPYWQADDALWTKLKESGKVTEDSLQEYVDNKTAILLEQGVAPTSIAMRVSRLPLVQQMSRATSDIRNRIRYRDKAIDDALAIWYGYTPVRLQG